VTNPEDAPEDKSEIKWKLEKASKLDSNRPGTQASGRDSSQAESSADEKSVPPFLWNGVAYLPALVHALDSLGDSNALRSWYGPGYPYQSNPLALPWSLTEHPATPCAVQEWVRVAGTVEKRVNMELLSRHKDAVEERRKWRQAFVVVGAALDPDAVLKDGIAKDPVVVMDESLDAIRSKIAEQEQFADLSQSHGFSRAQGILGLEVDPNLPREPTQVDAEAPASKSLKSRARRGRRHSLVNMDGFVVEIDDNGSDGKPDTEASNK